MKKSGKIIYPEFINDISYYLGMMRSMYNHSYFGIDKRYYRDENHYKVDEIGIKGELIFSYYLHTINIKHTLSKVINSKPIIDCDIYLNEYKKKIEIKTIKNDGQHFMVMIQRHNKKIIDYYCFIKLNDDNTADYSLVSYNDVASWQIKNFRYGDSYYKRINELINTNE